MQQGAARADAVRAAHVAAPERTLEKTIQIKRRARRFAQEGAIAEAIVEYDKLLLSGECDPYDYVAAGDLHARRGETEGAIERYRQAASAYESVGLYKNAIAVLKKVLRTDSDRRDVHRQLGELYATEGLVGDAVRHYLEFARGGTADDPLVVEALERAGALIHGEGPEEVEELAGAPAAPPVWDAEPIAPAERGVVSVRDEVPAEDVPVVDLEALIGELTEGLRHQIAGNDHQSHYDLGVSHMEMGLFEEAVAEFDRAVEDQGLRLRAIEMAGVCYIKMGCAEEAVRRLGHGLAASGSDEQEMVGLRYHLAEALEQAGRHDEAARQIAQVHRIDPGFLKSQGIESKMGEGEALELE
jgi:tetratricopeptide (TPR) repeat protein